MSSKTKRKPMTMDAIVDVEATQTEANNAIEGNKERDAGQRAHVKQLTLYLPHPVYRQLREIAFHEEKRMHALLLEGLNRLFADRGAPSIEELTRIG